MADHAKLLSLLEEASTEALRAGEIVGHLRRFIEKGTPQLQKAELNEIACAVAHLLRHELESEHLTLDLELAPRPLPILADRIQIEQIIVNLIQNAIFALRDLQTDGRRIRLGTPAVKGMAEVCVHDTGAGVSPATAAQMFEPFFSTKSSGLGMGLAISRSIIQAHRGKIWVESAQSDAKGATVRFALPLHPHNSRTRSRAS